MSLKCWWLGLEHASKYRSDYFSNEKIAIKYAEIWGKK